jgi:hypothetical protein
VLTVTVIAPAADDIALVPLMTADGIAIGIADVSKIIMLQTTSGTVRLYGFEDKPA